MTCMYCHCWHQTSNLRYLNTCVFAVLITGHEHNFISIDLLSFLRKNRQLVNLLKTYFQPKDYLQNDLFIECSFRWIVICWQSPLLDSNHCWVTGWLNPDRIPSWSEAMENNSSTHSFRIELHLGGGGEAQIKQVFYHIALTYPSVSHTLSRCVLLSWYSLTLLLYLTPWDLKALESCVLLLNKYALTDWLHAWMRASFKSG